MKPETPLNSEKPHRQCLATEVSSPFLTFNQQVELMTDEMKNMNYSESIEFMKMQYADDPRISKYARGYVLMDIAKKMPSL